jgi:hypothetical protein
LKSKYGDSPESRAKIEAELERYEAEQKEMMQNEMKQRMGDKEQMKEKKQGAEKGEKSAKSQKPKS